MLALCSTAGAHDIITTKITWNTDIARIVFARCAACHRPGGMAFSMLTYKEARPWAVAIKEEVLTRRMPPWGAAKGFGEFRNDGALSPEEIERFVSWTDGGVPEEPAEETRAETPADGTPAGDQQQAGAGGAGEPGPVAAAGAASIASPVAAASEPGSIAPPQGPPEPPEFVEQEPYARSRREIVISGDFELPRDFQLDGLWPETVPKGESMRILAQLPDGVIEPLLWLDGYREEFGHPFLLRRPMLLPKGTMIHGVPDGARIALLPGSESAESVAAR